MTPETPIANQLSAAARRALIGKAYAGPSRAQREEAQILSNLPLVRHIVQKIASHFSRKVDLENLMSAGTLGLVRAARSYDETHEAEFRTYAYIRIRGAVIDELRSESFVPSGSHRQIRVARDAYHRYCQRTGHPPADEDLAAELGISPAQLYRIFEEARKQQFLSIHGLGGDGETDPLMPADAAEGPDIQAERKELLETLTRAIAQLPARDRQVVLLYYERDLTMKEIAAVLSVTESRVSQLHASALFKLSMTIKEPE